MHGERNTNTNIDKIQHIDTHKTEERDKNTSHIYKKGGGEENKREGREVTRVQWGIRQDRISENTHITLV